MTSRQYDTIDERVAAEIRRLHDEYPKLGHEGLVEALSQQGIDVDDQDMKSFMRRHKLNPGIVRQSWGWVASRWRFGWGFPEQRPPLNRSSRRFWRHK